MDAFIADMIETGLAVWNWFPADWQTVLLILGKIILILVPLMLCVAYVTYAERKIIGYMQVRIGPNRVGPRGWLQPIADAVKLMFKEVIIPTQSNKFLFLLAPVLSIAPALAAWAVIPFDRGMVLTDVDAGLLYILALTSVGVYGVIIAGWASNSKYAIMSSLRAGAQRTHDGVFGVGGPAGDDDAVHPDRGQRQNIEQAGIDIGQHHAAIERNHRPRRQRRRNRQHRRQQEQELVGLRRDDDFLEHQLDRIRNRLQPATRADAVGADAHLHVTDNLALGVSHIGHAQHQRHKNQNDFAEYQQHGLPVGREPVPHRQPGFNHVCNERVHQLTASSVTAPVAEASNSLPRTA